MPSSAGSAPPCPPSARLLYCQAVPLGGRGEVFAVAGVVRDAAAVWAGGLHSGWNARRMRRFDRRSPPSLHCCWWKIIISCYPGSLPRGGEAPLPAPANLIACVCCWCCSSIWPLVGFSVARVGARWPGGMMARGLPWRDSWRGPKLGFLLWGLS